MVVPMDAKKVELTAAHWVAEKAAWRADLLVALSVPYSVEHWDCRWVVHLGVLKAGNSAGH